MDNKNQACSITNESALADICAVVAGGGSSNMRNSGTPRPLVVQSAQGCMIRDVEGNSLIDLNMGYGPHLFGYGDGDVWGRIGDQARIAHMTGLPGNLDAHAASLIRELVPSMEQIRFANSGTEAIASALRLARTLTGRTLVLTFEGHYHGWSETILRKVSPEISPEEVVPGAPGMVPNSLDHTRQIRWNDFDAVDRAFADFGDSISAVILEPVLANDGVAVPADGFLEHLRGVTRRFGALLIFDEVITGFRVARGGAQALYGVTPDITIFSKAMAGGFPVSAFGGSLEVMEPLARNEAVHAGVFAGNHLAMAAIVATLEKIIANPQLYDVLEENGLLVEKRLANFGSDDLPTFEFVRVGSLIGFSLISPQEGVDGGGGRARNRSKFEMAAHRDLQMRCQQRGVYFHPNPREPWFLSTAHDEEHLSAALDVICDELVQLKAAS